MKIKPKIALDLDDVILDTTRMMLKYFNETHNKRVLYEDLKTYNFEDYLGIPHDKWYEFEMNFYATEHNAKIPLREGALAGINLLSCVFELHIITARPIEVENYVFLSLGQHFSPGDFTRIHMTKSLSGSRNVQKWEVCKEYGIPLLVDDYHHHVNLAAQNGLFTMLLDAPWNQNEKLHQSVQRVRNWDELADSPIG